MAELVTILTALVETFGVGGLALTFSVYFLMVLQKKLDKLIEVNTKMFGILISLSKKPSKYEVEE